MMGNRTAPPGRGAVDPAVRPSCRDSGWTGWRWHGAAGDAARRAPPPRGLRALSDRYRGATVIAMRTHPIPRAYRTFYRQIGLDPDRADPVASGRRSTVCFTASFARADLIADALLVARARDRRARLGAGRRGGRRHRPRHPGESGRRPAGTGAGWLRWPAVARRRRPTRVHAPLFGTPLPGHGSGAVGGDRALYAVGVAGVPQIHVEEALWLAADAARLAGVGWVGIAVATPRMPMVAPRRGVRRPRSSRRPGSRRGGGRPADAARADRAARVRSSPRRS